MATIAGWIKVMCELVQIWRLFFFLVGRSLAGLFVSACVEVCMRTSLVPELAF